MILEFLPEASDELYAAAEFYEQKEEGLGWRFRNEVLQVCRLIVQQPVLWRERSGGYRRVNCPVFPYYVAYLRRIKEELSGKGRVGGPDPRGQILSVFVAGGNRVNDYDVVSAGPSRYAAPMALLRQIHGETTMGWTGWVFEMKDGKRFAYGSGFSMEFCDVPEGYSFDDVTKVHNHSCLGGDGTLLSLERGAVPPASYRREKLFRERVYFTCYIEGI